MEEKTIVSKKKLVESLQKNSPEKIDGDVIALVQKFAEKMVTDIVTRACLISKHKNQDFLSSEDISFIIEKDFDYAFGKKKINRNVMLPTEEYNSKIAEIRSNKPY